MRIWTTEEAALITEKYNTCTCSEIATILGRSESSCQNRAFVLGLKKGCKKYSHNDQYFSTPTVENSYWAGLLAADGTIRNLHGTNYVIISLKREDRYHLERFGKDLSYTGIVKDRVSKDSYNNSVLEICACSGLVEKLHKVFNVVPKKSLILQPPNLDVLDHKLAYIKGYWDGDGCIRIDEKERLETSCCGTLEVLSWIQNIFDELVPPQGKYHAVARLRKTGSKAGKNHADYKITGHRAESIFRKLRELKTPELDRKWSILDNVERRSYNNKCYETWRNRFYK